MNTDIRLSVGFWRHPKTVKLQRRLGLEAVRSLQILWLWAAENRPSGDLSGLDDEDISIAADWTDEARSFAGALSSIGFLDGESGSYSLHGWLENNSWAAAEPSRGDKGRFSKLKSMEATKPVAQALEKAGVCLVSKADYAGLKDEATRGATLERMLKDASSTPAGSPQENLLGDPRVTQGDTQGSPLAPAPVPAPIPTPTPIPIPAPNAHKEACVSDPRSYSPEDVEEAKDGIRREADAVRAEFDELREAYKAVRDDGPMAGWPEYQQARRSKGWPGLLFVLDRLQTLIEQDDQWKRGYKEGLRRFLTDRMWEMEPRKAAPAPNAEPEKTAEDKALDEKIAKMRAEMKAKEAARKKARGGW